MRTLLEKELRENLRWLLVGLALIGSLLWYATPETLADRVDLTENSIATQMLLGATLFALGLCDAIVRRFANGFQIFLVSSIRFDSLDFL